MTCAVLAFAAPQAGRTASEPKPDIVKVEGGTLEAIPGARPGVRLFGGAQYAAPPAGPLRWKAPRPAPPWNGVRKSENYGDRCAQQHFYGDMVFRDVRESEDCLYVDIRTPAKSERDRLPIFVWFHGGFFGEGPGSEPRYDGTWFASKGIVVVNVNYRLSIFGFLAHPELSAESPRGASGGTSGSYGILDQVAALRWVNRNIGSFGGDSGRVTIGGESAGSFAVSALMASPLAQGLFQLAIGESGSFLTLPGGLLETKSLAEAERQGAAWTAGIKVRSIAELRAESTAEILNSLPKENRFPFAPIVDYFLPATALSIYAKGGQSHIPLLAGWNGDEARIRVLAAKPQPTAATFAAQLRAKFGYEAPAELKL